MRKLFFVFFLLLGFMSYSQQQTKNLILVTTDGFRWQDLFTGMDSALANDARYNQDDSDYIYKNYWHSDPLERRKKLLPFFWSTIEQKGQIYGNRLLGSKVDNANKYWFSYPGYNELLTGYPDTAINKNSYPANPHVTVLEFLNRQPAIKGKVAVFGAWNAFDRIINEERSGIPVFSAFDKFGGKAPNASERLIDAMNQQAHRPFGEAECLDVFTHFAAMEFLKAKKPRVLYIAYGETDEWAHAGQYRSYLDAARQFDAWLKEIWDYVQKDPQYRGKTTLLISTDHGRGISKKEDWKEHNNNYPGSQEMWLAVIGPDSPVRGELKETMQLYQEQIAQTLAKLMGYTYKANHPIASEILYVFKMKK